MSAAGLLVKPHNASGLRPVQLRSDLPAIVDLIEVCFASTLDSGGRAVLDDMRALSHLGPLLWLVARFDRSLPFVRGFVWVEHGRLVGNVSLIPAGFDRGWVIANVAVEPGHRRRGIARRMMTAALDFVAQKGTFATLQVDGDNSGARDLYESLGFRAQRTFVHWRRAGYYRAPDPLPGAPTLHRMAESETDQLLALAERVRPNSRGGLGWLRPTRPAALRPGRLSDLRYTLIGNRTDFWTMPRSNGALAGALRVESRLGGMTRMLDLLVDPASQGTLELPLVNAALRLLVDRRRALVTDHPEDDYAGNDALRAHDFRPERTLVHMIRPVQ